MRLIDADELKNRLKEYCIDRDKEIKKYYEIMGIDDCVDKAPTIDAVTYEEWFSTNCETCKEYDKEKHCCPKFRGVIKQALKDFEENNKIVRCKDCKFAQNKRYNSRVDGKNSVLCEHVTTEDGRYELKVFRNANDFCSYGERKTDE